MTERLRGASFPIWFSVDEWDAIGTHFFTDPKKAKRFARMWPTTRMVEAECRILLAKNFKRKTRAKRTA